MWRMAFASTPATVLQRATVEWAAAERFFPALSELRKRIDRLTGDAIEFEIWLEAWSKVEHGMAAYRSHSAVHFTNWLTEHLVTTMGSIEKLASADEIGRAANRAAFRDAYQQLVARAQDNPDLMQQCIAWRRQMDDRRLAQQDRMRETRETVPARNIKYYGAGRTPEDEDLIAAALGYIQENGRWRRPTPDEAKARGLWRGADQPARPSIETDVHDPQSLDESIKALGDLYRGKHGG